MYLCNKCGYAGKGGPEHPGKGCPYLAGWIADHNWVNRPPVAWEFCLTCGIVKRADGKNRPCKGPTKLRVGRDAL
jgi:hypothetical protein